MTTTGRKTATTREVYEYAFVIGLPALNERCANGWRFIERSGVSTFLVRRTIVITDKAADA